MFTSPFKRRRPRWPAQRWSAVLLAALATLPAAPLAAADDTVPSLGWVAANARYRLSASPERFLAGFEGPSRVVGAGLVDGGNGAAWANFAAGAVQLHQASGPDGASLWYNPVLDIGLLLRWRHAPTGWILTDGRWLSGKAIDPQAGPGCPLGNDRALSCDPGRGLSARATALLTKAMAGDLGAMAGSPDAHDLAVTRTTAAAGAIDRLAAIPGFARARSTAVIMLNGFDGPVPGPGLGDALHHLSEDAVLRLRAVAAYERKGKGWNLVVQTPDAPGVAFFVAFKLNRHGEARPASIRLCRYYAPAKSS